METVRRDDVTLAYTDAGQGDPPIVLVHGWTCDHSHFAPQEEYCRRRPRVVAVDLRGHGESDKPEQEYTIGQFTDDLVWLCRELGLVKPVIIGHSMGGVIAFDLAARYPDLPSAIVALDSPIIPPQDLRDAIGLVVAGLKTADYEQVARDFVANALFLPTDDPAVKIRVVEEMASAPQYVMYSALEDIFATDTEASTAAVKVPALLLNASGALADVDRIKELNPNIMVGQTVGAGHFHHLIVPGQVNAMIEQFLAVALPTPATA